VTSATENFVKICQLIQNLKLTHTHTHTQTHTHKHIHTQYGNFVSLQFSLRKENGGYLA